MHMNDNFVVPKTELIMCNPEQLRSSASAISGFVPDALAVFELMSSSIQGAKQQLMGKAGIIKPPNPLIYFTD